MKNNKQKQLEIAVDKKADMPRELKVSTLESLRKYADGGAIIELQPFAEGVPFVARLKRPSLLGLVAQGKIPNSLMGIAAELFDGKDVNTKDNFVETHDILMLFARECLVEPTMEQLESIGLELTDEQLILIFNYAQHGVRALESFRVQQAFSKLVNNMQQLPPNTSASTGDK